LSNPVSPSRVACSTKPSRTAFVRSAARTRATSSGDDPWQPDAAPAPDAGEQRRLEAWVATRLPGLAGRALRSDRHPWTMTPDGDFAIGAVGAVTIAAGCSGHAFKFGPALGELIADTSDGNPRPTAAMFALDRAALSRPAPAPSTPINR
jgi:sarcosine oxidase